MALCEGELNAATLKLVGSVTCSTFGGLVRRAEGLRVGLQSVMRAVAELVPHRGLRIGMAQQAGGNARHALQVGQRRHVHDRHARHHATGPWRRAARARPARHIAAPASPVRRGHSPTGRRRHGTSAEMRPGRLPRVDLDQTLAATHRQPHAGALAVDDLGLAGKADELHVVPRERQLRRQKRTV